MLRSLRVKNYVLIDSLDIDFPEGLIIITGQTGAGKSIILGALSLLMGSKADASSIREGEDSCVVEAEFDIKDETGTLKELFEENDVEWDNGHLVIRRVVHSTGRSRSFVNDCPVPVTLLASISSNLIDIHSQQQSLQLSDHNFQLSVLDFYAGNSELLDRCKESYRRLQTLKSELDELNARMLRLDSEKDYNESQFRQLDSAKLREGELEELETEQKQLANAEEIKGDLFQIESLELSSPLRDVSRLLQRISKFVPDAESLSERIESCRIEIEDILSDVSNMNSRFTVSEGRLSEVEERMSELYSLLRKNNCATISDLISYRDSLNELLYDFSSFEEKKESLEKELGLTRDEFDGYCSEIHSRRAAAAPQIAKSIQDSLRFLELESSLFAVDIEDVPASATGKDKAVFRFSASGSSPVDVSKCASGGEISRIMLCLKALLAKYRNMPTMFFDEIDTGVSGSVADKMGSMICSMGADMQVFAITHLPQVAAKGQAHYLVQKESEGKVLSTIKKLSAEQRVLEVARMLSGSTVTPEAIANAKSLLGN